VYILPGGSGTHLRQPGRIYTESYEIDIPPDLPPGTYALKMKLYSTQEERNVLLALDPEFLDERNFYEIASINVYAEQR
jgi:hypothetical protein